MHIHHVQAGLQPNSSYAAGSNRAAAAQQAAETRKRLRRSAQSIEAESDPDAMLLIGQWLDSGHSQGLPGDEYHSASEDSDSDLA